MAIEIVDLPIIIMVIFHSYGAVYQEGDPINYSATYLKQIKKNNNDTLNPNIVPQHVPPYPHVLLVISPKPRGKIPHCMP